VNQLDKRRFGQQTPRRWGLGNPAEETFCHPNQIEMNFTLYLAIGIDRNQNTVFNLGNPYITGTKA